MAVIQSAATGVAGTGATWVGGVAPGAGDTFEVLTGHTVTFNANMTVQGWTQKGSGRLMLSAGVVLTATGSDMIVEGDSNDVAKVVLAAGAELRANPSTGVTITLRIGTDYFRYAEVEARGTSGSHCKIGKTGGAGGTFNIRHAQDIIWLYGVLDCEYTDFPGVGATDIYPRHHGKVILKNCTVDGTFDVAGYDMTAPDYSGYMNFEDTIFNGIATLTGNGTGTPLTIKRCECMTDLSINWPGGNTPGTLTLHDTIMHRTLNGAWSNGIVDIKGLFLYHRSANGTTGQYNFMGKHLDCYAFADYRDHADQVNGGNPHFWSANADGKTQRLEGCIIDYRGPVGPDTGDAGDLHSGSMEVVNCILLPSDNAGLSSGAFWWLGGTGVLDVRHSTIHCSGPNPSGGVRFPHSVSMGASQVKVRDCLFWSPETTGQRHAIVNDSPGSSVVDALAPTDCIGNAFIGLTTGTCSVNGTPTSIMGMDAVEFSVLPTGNITLGTGGANFVDQTRDMLAWGRAELGLSGSDDAVRDAILTAVRADKTIVRTGLIPWVREGFTPQEATLETAASDGGTPGAVAFAEEAEPLVWTTWPESLPIWEAKVLPKALLRAQEMIDAAALRVGGGGDTNTMSITYYDAMRVYQNLAVRFPAHATLFLQAAEAGYYLYVTDFLEPGGYQAPGHWNFTTGLYQMWVRTGDVKYKNVILALSLNAAYAADGVASLAGDINFVRENSYAVMSHLNARKVGQAVRDVTAVRIADMWAQSQGVLDDALTQEGDPELGTFGGGTLQTFMVAIMAEAFKMLYEQSTDVTERANIVARVQAIADHTYNDRWRSALGYFYYGVDDGPDLNLYIAPMYAWLWHKTGYVRHRDRFDAIFWFGVLGGWLDPHKQFNQQNIKVWKGIEERQEAVDTSNAIEDDSVTTYTLSGPPNGFINGVSGSFTVTLGTGTVTGTIRFTPQSSGGTGVFIPTFLDLTDSTRSGTFTYIPSSLGSRVISSPDNSVLTDPSGIAFDAVAEPPVEPSPNQAAPFIPGDSVVIIGGVGGERVLIIPWDGKR